MQPDDHRGRFQKARTARWLRVAELSAWSLGLALLGLYILARAQGALARASDLERFELTRAELVESSLSDENRANKVGEPEQSYDLSLWAEGRIQKYRESLAHDLGLPAGVLRIPKLDLAVPVHEGTDELVLNRAVGHIEGTAALGEAGNVGIAGHRDGIFRGLKDIELGDVLRLETLTRTDTYVIDRITIVDPTDVHVLDPTPEPAVTLVTCYPFYYVGKAPKRFIVRATLQASTEAFPEAPVATVKGADDSGRH